MASSLRLSIPESDRMGLMQLLQLPEADVEQLTAAIAATPPTFRSADFATQIANKTYISANVEDIVRVLITLYSVRADIEVSIPDFVPLVRDAVERSIPIETRMSDDSWRSFKARLEALLSLDYSLGVVAKASHLLSSHAHIFHGVRVFTDLRPVFRDDPNEAPVAGVIVHHVKIAYHDGDQLSEFFVALANEDLRRLRLSLQRAEAKAKSLRAFMETNAQLPVLEEES